jgi:hypothetical protein
VAYTHLKEALMDEETHKLVVVAHSQGGIVLGMALDSLLADLPRECIHDVDTRLRIDFKKLEIYTFGCAANHFNNPKNKIAGDKATIPS